MKNRKIQSIISLLILSLALASLSGCLNGAPPSKVESYLFDVKTNFTPVLVTNTVTQYRTNEVTAQVETNQSRTITTNLVPYYDWSTSDKGKAASAAIGAAGTALGVPFAGAATGLVLSLWGWVRTSRRAANLGTSLSQIVETGREILKQVPNGDKYDLAFVNFMQKHQTETGTISQVSQILEDNVSNADAKVAAQDIIDLVTGFNPKAESSLTAPLPRSPA